MKSSDRCSIDSRSSSGTRGVVATETLSRMFRSCSTWLCLRLCRSAEGAFSGSEVRKTAVPGARITDLDFSSISISDGTAVLLVCAFL